MKHLGPSQLVDVTDGVGTAHATQHVADCAVCSEQLRALRATVTLNEAARDSGSDVPEPSPLFWSHFPERVRTALEHAVQREPGWLTVGVTGRWRGLALTATLVVGVMTGVAVSRLTTSEPTDPRGAATVMPSAEPTGGGSAEAGAFIEHRAPGSLEADPRWALVLLMAETVGWKTPDAMDRFVAGTSVHEAVSELSREEQQELKRLLEIEIGTNGTEVL